MIHTKSVNPALGLRALVAGVWFGAGMGRGSAGAQITQVTLWTRSHVREDAGATKSR